ncbi:SGNH/GDSL hydrolase family protein [bacterium]|nr:SGNH/GDSL hydrolase family protein [bacterium]
MRVDYGLGFDEDTRLFVPAGQNGELRFTDPFKLSSFEHEEFSAKKPPNTLRIMMLGGSSVRFLEGHLRALERELKAILSGKYKDVEIINCGGSSYGSGRLAIILLEVLEYGPDLIILHTGHNEFQELKQLKLAHLSTVKLQKTVSKSAFVRLMRDRLAEMLIAYLEFKRNKEILETSDPITTVSRDYDWSIKQAKRRMELFRENMTLMAEICANNDVPMIIGTLPTNLYDPWLRRRKFKSEYSRVRNLTDEGKWEEAKILGKELLSKIPVRGQASELENGIIREIAQKYNIPLADVEKAVEENEPYGFPGLTLFRDYCHLNYEGNEVLIQTYKDEILKLFRSPKM